MYLLETSFELPCAHKLCLPYESKCVNLHGHTYKFVVRIGSFGLTPEGMVIDFHKLKQAVLAPFIEKLDHKVLNDVINENPTTEYLARYAFEFIEDMLIPYEPAFLKSVTVWESPTNAVTYSPA